MWATFQLLSARRYTWWTGLQQFDVLDTWIVGWIVLICMPLLGHLNHALLEENSASVVSFSVACPNCAAWKFLSSSHTIFMGINSGRVLQPHLWLLSRIWPKVIKGLDCIIGLVSYSIGGKDIPWCHLLSAHEWRVKLDNVLEHLLQKCLCMYKIKSSICKSEVTDMKRDIYMANAASHVHGKALYLVNRWPLGGFTMWRDLVADVQSLLARFIAFFTFLRTVCAHACIKLLGSVRVLSLAIYLQEMRLHYLRNFMLKVSSSLDLLAVSLDDKSL